MCWDDSLAIALVVVAVFWATFLAVLVAALLVVARRESDEPSGRDEGPALPSAFHLA
jgi:hypothetical protein